LFTNETVFEQGEEEAVNEGTGFGKTVMIVWVLSR
jgi:hypothetical protein